MKGTKSFNQFTPDIPLAPFQSSCHLHRDGAGAGSCFHPENIFEKSPGDRKWIDAGMGIEIFILLGNDGLFQERRDLIQLGLHPPFLIAGQIGIDNFTFAVGNDRGVFDLNVQWEDQV